MTPYPRRFPSKSASAVLLAPVFLSGLLASAFATILPAPTVTNSSPAFNPSFAASNSVDNTELEYASQSSGVNTFLEYSFGTPRTFDSIVLVNRDSGGQSDLIGNFTLTLDGGPSVQVTRNPQRGASGLHFLGGTFTATNVRIDVDTIGVGDSFNNTGVQETLFVLRPANRMLLPAVVAGSAPAFNPFFAAENAVDGVVGRASGGTEGPEYASASLGADTFIDFDFGQNSLVGGFDFFDRLADEDRITGFNLIFSNDPFFGDPEDVVRSYGNSGIGNSDVFAGINARFVRFDVTSNLGGPSANTGISEITFYQVPEPSALGLLSLGALLAARRCRRR